MSEPDWLPPCREKVRMDGYRMCAQIHCEDIGNMLHRRCACDLPSQPKKCSVWPHPGCCEYPLGSYIETTDAQGPCACCCTCFAYGTPIAVAPDTFKAIEEFVVGDAVLVAGPELNWQPKMVKFSQGTGEIDRALSIMTKVSYRRNGEETYLIVTNNHLFLMPNGKLKRADKLVPWSEEAQVGDKLRLADGGETPVLSLHAGVFVKGIHHIATTDEVATQIDGHLLNSNGVVTADYALQIANLDQEPSAERALAFALADSHADLPSFGTRAYLEAYPHLYASEFHATSTRANVSFNVSLSAGASVASTDHFELLGQEPIPIPPDAEHFISKAQAEYLKEYHADNILPPDRPLGAQAANYLFSIYQAFYPDVQFRIDYHAPTPNASSFLFQDVPFVVVNGGLLRWQGANFEMLAFVIAHEIGHLYGGPPKTQTQKYSCSGQADYAAITGIMPHAWYGRYYQDVLQGAVAQLDTFFGYFGDGPIAQGTSGDTCLDISIECRKQVIKAAMSTFDLPECAGGPKASTLEVTGAVASRAQDGTEVVVSFSAPIGVDALASEHYKLVPEAAVKTAEIKSGEGSKIYLQIDGVKPGVEYTLMVKDVLSADGHPLIARKSTATFTLKEEET